MARHLVSAEPLDLLLYVSGFLAALDPRRKNPFHYGDLALGTPDLLVASRRREIIANRDDYRTRLTAAEAAG